MIDSEPMKILRYPDPMLTEPNARILRFGPEEAAKVMEMFRLMMASDGSGLAAPQVGWNVRLFILPLQERGQDGALRTRPLVFFNPTVQGDGPKAAMQEGCMSFPGIYADVERWLSVRIRAETPQGPAEGTVDGFMAQAIQHENDHLDGILFIDRLSSDERARIEPQLKELRSKKD